MLANLAIALIEHQRITTTDAKAKDLRRVADRLVTLGKEGSLAARRRAFAQLRSNGSVDRLFGELAERYRDRNGGYTRVLKMGPRRGDSAPMSIIEFVDRPEAE